MSKGGSDYGGGYDKSDAAKDTGSSTSKVSEAWHDARNDAVRDGGHGISSSRGVKDGSNDSGK